MRSQYAVALGAVLFFSGWYYYSAAHPCIYPLSYSLGAIDERFGLDTTTVKRLTAEAEEVWEDALGRQLFTYEENASFQIDFVYDERQERSEEADDTKAALDAKENASQSINEEYTRLLAEYDELKKEYEAKVARYNTRLQNFNTTVAQYNETGGAPSDVFRELQKTEQNLKTEERALAREADALAALAKNINEVSARGNRLISEYNAGVVQYNQTYTGREEFTQGDYHGDGISVYHFKDQAELKNVLVHEFGHAIGLPHVDGASSIMYYLMDKQPTTSELAPEDLAALGAVCKPNDSISTRFHQLVSSLYSKLSLI